MPFRSKKFNILSSVNISDKTHVPPLKSLSKEKLENKGGRISFTDGLDVVFLPIFLFVLFFQHFKGSNFENINLLFPEMLYFLKFIILNMKLQPSNLTSKTLIRYKIAHEGRVFLKSIFNILKGLLRFSFLERCIWSLRWLTRRYVSTTRTVANAN